jgi:hypothetical protein
MANWVDLFPGGCVNKKFCGWRFSGSHLDWILVMAVLILSGVT